VFVALHGAAGEDGAIRDVLDLLEVPYVGSDAAACRLAFDKPTAKSLVAAAGVATPRCVALAHSAFRDFGASAVLDRIVAALGLPLVVKPSRGGSALGVSVVRDAAELPGALMSCFSYGDVALVEQHVAGIELAVSVVDVGDGPVVLPPVEIRADDGVFDYAARYTPGRTEYVVPAALEPTVAQGAAAAALAAHRALGLRDLSRTDLIVSADGTACFLEVNVAPGMTETSMLPMSAQAAGLDLGTLCRDLLARAADR
jgi:D-alanine-D-alanine ligase